MLACNNDPGVKVSPGVETTVTEWIADGQGYMIGFTGTGSYSAEFRLYVGNVCQYVYQTSPGNRTAYIADRAEKVPAGVNVSLKVVHYDSSTQDFKGTILGGK